MTDACAYRTDNYVNLAHTICGQPRAAHELRTINIEGRTEPFFLPLGHVFQEAPDASA